MPLLQRVSGIMPVGSGGSRNGAGGVDIGVGVGLEGVVLLGFVGIDCSFFVSFSVSSPSICTRVSSGMVSEGDWLLVAADVAEDGIAVSIAVMVMAMGIGESDSLVF